LLVNRQYRTTTGPIIIVGLFVGALLSWGVLTGDSQGRVNLLYLIAIYVLLPILSMLVSLTSLALNKSANFAGLLASLPVWPTSKKVQLQKQKQHPDSRLVLFYQSQLAAISFSLASLLIFLLLLLTTDINFVWRSTILDAEQIFPLLSLIATPWFYIESAQPSLELLTATQDSRINNNQLMAASASAWWQFVLATQVVYALLLRSLMVVASASVLRFKELKRSKSVLVKRHRETENPLTYERELQRVSDIAEDYAVTNWAGLKDTLIEQVKLKLTGSSINDLPAGPAASYAEQLVSERWQEPQLLIVKGWEPPLAELSDYMQNGCGYLLPVDWNDDGFQKLSNTHLQEWQRFLNNLACWQLLQLET
jgi:hypothetical protein